MGNTESQSTLQCGTSIFGLKYGVETSKVGILRTNERLLIEALTSIKPDQEVSELLQIFPWYRIWLIRTVGFDSQVRLKAAVIKAGVEMRERELFPSAILDVVHTRFLCLLKHH